jgi:hypothetical protein
MTQITLDQAREYLASVGIVMPDFMLQLFVDRANTIAPCLDEHYDSATATLILMYLIGMFGVVGGGGRYVMSQTAPSGASQSYRYGALADNYRSARSLLTLFDPFGCATGLIPPQPGANLGMWVGQGGCDCV